MKYVRQSFTFLPCQLPFALEQFGKGTAPADGMALLASMIISIVASPNPRVVITTHFLELFEYDLLGDTTPSILKYKMDYILPPCSGAEGAEGESATGKR